MYTVREFIDLKRLEELAKIADSKKKPMPKFTDNKEVIKKLKINKN